VRRSTFGTAQRLRCARPQKQTGRKLLVVYPIALALAAAACGHGSKGLSGDVYNATVRAVSALERASERKTDPEILFAPLFVDLQKSVDEVRIAGGPSSEAWGDLQHCTSVLELFRLTRQRVGGDLELLELKGKKVEVSEADKKDVEKSFKDLDACIATVKAYE
jgi:hypothetical protein